MAGTESRTVTLRVEREIEIDEDVMYMIARKTLEHVVAEHEFTSPEMSERAWGGLLDELVECFMHKYVKQT